MNRPDDCLPQPEEERELEAALSPLKGLEPPLEARVANRRAVAAALSSCERWSQPTLRPWWRRSVSIPVPLALGLALLMSVALSMSFYGWREGSRAHLAGP